MPFSEIFRHPKPLTVAKRELEEAQRQLLQAQTGLEYAQAMVQYHRARTLRLSDYIARSETAPDATEQ